MQLFGLTGYLTINERKFRTRIAFHVETIMAGSAGGKTTIDVFNLSKESRDWIETNADKSTISLFAGYQGDDRLIFQGGYNQAPTVREGTELKTSIQCYNGQYLWQAAHIEFSGAQNDAQIYSIVLGKLASYGIAKGHYSQVVQKAFEAWTYPKGCSDAGLASHVLNNLVKRHGFKYGIDAGALNLYDPDHYEEQDEFLLSKSTGLIGFPSKTGTTDKGGIYQLTSLYNPELICGRKVLVQSVAFKGLTELKINKLVHSGDTWRGQGHTEMEAVPLGTRKFLVVQP